MRITENRVLAAAVCVICALVSVLGVGGWKLSGRYDDVTEAFVQGADERHNMEAYLDRCVQYAGDLAHEAAQYLDSGELADAVLEYAAALGAQNGPGGDRYQNFVMLTSGVEALYSALQEAGAADETNIALAYGDYQSVLDLIRRDEYYAIAAEYNELADSFPAGNIAAVWGVDKADSFGR